MNYTIVIKKDGYIQAMYNKTLQNDQEEITPYYLTSTSNIGDNQDLKIELYKGNTTSVYRTLKLKYNVV